MKCESPKVSDENLAEMARSLRVHMSRKRSCPLERVSATEDVLALSHILAGRLKLEIIGGIKLATSRGGREATQAPQDG